MPKSTLAEFPASGFQMFEPDGTLAHVCFNCSILEESASSQIQERSPKKEIFGAGWQIMEKVLKSGFITPPLIANFKWKDKDGEHQEIRFYPFVPKRYLKKYKLPEHARRANYWMFNYIGLDGLTFFVLYNK